VTEEVKAAQPDPNVLRQETEVESLLGPDVKTPSGIPKDYRPLESSTHALFRIELGDDFAGPLDLLLYLIKKHDVDVFDIPIKLLTDKYLEMLDTMEALPIDIAAEFLVLAAELTHIKSKMLLPAREGVAVEAEEGETVDPREELVRRLLEYQKYRDAANQLADRDQLGRDVFARVAPTQDVLDGDAGLKNVNVFRLVELMAALMKREEGHHEIQFETINIHERIEYVIAFGEAREGRFTLTQLLQGIASRHELVITFIAVLEMTRLQLLELYAEDPSPAREEATDALDEVLGTRESQRPTKNAEVDDLPVIWVKLTGKRLDAEVRDDYR
jgi:segregation and condensation protein A